MNQNNIFNQSSMDIQLSISISMKNMVFVYTMRDLLWLVLSDAFGTYQVHVEAQLFVATFFKGW